jgi:hypothetical protein
MRLNDSSLIKNRSQKTYRPGETAGIKGDIYHNFRKAAIITLFIITLIQSGLFDFQHYKNSPLSANLVKV